MTALLVISTYNSIGMKSIWEWNKGTILVLLLVIGVNINACTKDKESPTTETGNTVWDVIQSNQNLDTFAALITETGYAGSLESVGVKTVFAPTNAAFAALPAGFFSNISDEQKLDYLKYHVYSGEFSITDEMKRVPLTSLQGDPIFVDTGHEGGDLINNKGRFMTTNIQADNGMVHVIDLVLVPDQYGTIAQNLEKRYEYHQFYTLLENADLMGFLEAPGEITLITTSDEALNYYEANGYVWTEEEWAEILKYHIIEQDISAAGPGTRTALVTMSGDSVYLTVDEPEKYNINGNSDPYLSLQAVNGQILLTSGIMLPDKHLGILTLMDKRFYFNKIRAALAAAKLTGRLYNSDANPDEQFTMFMPRDEAAGIDNLPSDESELANILKYHILLEKVTLDQLQDRQSYTTWQGETLLVEKNGSAITVNGSVAVKLANLAGKNGVVYGLNGTLTPPTASN